MVFSQFLSSVLFFFVEKAEVQELTQAFTFYSLFFLFFEADNELLLTFPL